MDMWHCVGAGLASIFTCLSDFYLFVRRDLLFRLNRAERRESESLIADKNLGLTFDSERSAVSRALSSMSALWVYAFAIPEIFRAVLRSLITGLGGDRACNFGHALLLALHFVFERHIQRLRQESTTAEDEEVQGHWREKLDLRTLSEVGREKRLAYVQKLKRRLGTYLYQQDN